MSGPPVIATIDGWTLSKYDHEGAMLFATRGDVEVTVDKHGFDIDVRVSGGYYGCSHAIGLDRGILVYLVREAIARGLLTVEELTP